MLITVLKSKIHRVKVTDADLDYEGSIEIGKDLMQATGIKPYEKVLVANFTNGNRYETYAIEGAEGKIGVNGGGARYSCVGDIVTIFAFNHVHPSIEPKPRIVLVDENNRVSKTL